MDFRSSRVDLSGSNASLDRLDAPTSPKGNPRLGPRSVGDVPPEGSHRTMPPGAPPTNPRLQQTQAQVDEVVDIMRVNVDKVLERDLKLSELDDRADALQAGEAQFEASVQRLPRRSIGSYLISIVKVVALIIAAPVVIAVTTCLVTAAFTAEFAKTAYSALREVNRVGAGMAAFGAGVGGSVCGLVVSPFASLYVEFSLIKAAAQGRSVRQEINSFFK